MIKQFSDLPEQQFIAAALALGLLKESDK